MKISIICFTLTGQQTGEKLKKSTGRTGACSFPVYEEQVHSGVHKREYKGMGRKAV